MEVSKYSLNIPSTEIILEQLGLSFEEQNEAGNEKAFYGFPVPVITDHCPHKLQYLPLSKNLVSLSADDKSAFDKLNEKNLCVIICHSFDVRQDESGRIRSYNPFGGTLSFLAGLWDATEDPLMGAVLYSCSYIGVASPASTELDFPYFLRREQISSWLSSTYTIEQKLKYFESTI